MITTEGNYRQEINRKLCMARATCSTKHDTSLGSQTVSKSLKLCMTRVTALSIAVYGCESWSFTKKVKTKVEAFEVWTYRRLLRAS